MYLRFICPLKFIVTRGNLSTTTELEYSFKIISLLNSIKLLGTYLGAELSQVNGAKLLNKCLKVLYDCVPLFPEIKFII